MTTAPTGNEIPQVVFACVRNGGRSVIGRVLTEHYAQGRVRAVSAGTQPGEHIHPEVAEAKCVQTPSRKYIDGAFTRELERYDFVILSDAPAEMVSLTQQDAIESYVRDLGGGLLMAGVRDGLEGKDPKLKPEEIQASMQKGLMRAAYENVAF